MNTVYMYAVLNLLIPMCQYNITIYQCDLNLYQYCITVLMYHNTVIC